LSRWAYHKRLPHNPVKDSIYHWIDNNLIFIKLSILFSGLIAAISFVILPMIAKILVSFAGIISLLYPLSFRRNGRMYRLRDVPLLKIILIASVWSLSSVLLPASYSTISTTQWLLFALQWIYIVLITIPFDINDMETDKSNNVLTLPLYIGYKKSVSTVFILSVIYGAGLTFWMSINYRNLYTSNIIFAIGLFMLLASLLIFTAKKSLTVPKWLIMAVYDGSMILYAIWVRFVLG
jgi:4-hydroxybenzoate polyprenyltransferase